VGSEGSDVGQDTDIDTECSERKNVDVVPWEWYDWEEAENTKEQVSHGVHERRKELGIPRKSE
jgi:hypothetical protein